MPATPETATHRAQIIGIIVALAIQGATAVWWASKMDQRLSSVEEKVAASVAPIAALSSTVARLDERSVSMDKAMGRIEDKLDRGAASR